MSRKDKIKDEPSGASWKFPAVGVGLLALWAFFRFSGPIDARSNDLWWHLTAGRQMAAEARLPRVDDLSHTRLGQEWVNFEWLFQLGAHIAANAAGFNGLILLKAGLLAGQCALLWLTLARTGAPWPIGLPLAAFWIFALGARDFVRPEIFTYFFLTLLLAALANEREDRKRIGLAAALFALWANLHGGFSLGLIVLAAAAVGAQLDHSFSRKEPGLSPRAAALGAALLVAAAAACLNPYGTGVYGVIAEHARLMADQRGQPWQVMEWKPTPWQGFQSFWIYAGLAVLVGAASQLRTRKIDWTGNFILLAFLALAARYVRNAQIFVLVTLPFFARHAHALAGGLPSAPGALKRWTPWAASAVLAFLALRDYGRRFDPRADWSQVPAESADFLAQHGCPGNLYNPYSWGGYLAWRLHPQMRVFMDSRYLFVDLLREDHEARQSPAAWSAYLDGHNVACAVVAYPKGFKTVNPQRIAPGLLARPPRGENSWMFPAEKWALVHWDRGSMLFLRREGGKADPREYRHFRPDDYLFALARIKEGKLKREAVLSDIDRRLSQAPNDPSARYFQRLFSTAP